MTITIDTSVFVEMLLGQEKAEESRTLLEVVGEGNVDAVMSHFALHAIEAMIRSPPKLAEFLEDVENSKGLKIYDTTLSDEQAVTALSEKMKLDFDDCVQLYIARQTKSSVIVSFDKHFDSCEIPRREPARVLQELYKKESEKKTST